MSENFAMKILASTAKDLFSGNRRVSKILLVVAIAALAACCAPTATAQVPNQGGLLYSDNFNATGDVNTDMGTSGRNSGPLATSVQFDTANATGGSWSLDGTQLVVTNPDPTPENPQAMYAMGLNYNFGGNLALGGMKISYDFTALTNDFSWGGTYSGGTSSVPPAWANPAADANNFLHFNSEGTGAGWNWYYLASSAASGRYETHFGDTGVTNYNVVHHADILLSDYVDGNPFNNSGTILADYYIDGKCVGSLWDIWDLADMQNNFLGFIAWQVPGSSFAFDNLKVYGNTVLLDTSNQWQGAVGANWMDASNWTVSVPNARGANALILNTYGTAHLVNVDADVVIGNLCLMNDTTSISSTTGKKITFYANEGANSQLQVLQVHSTQTISVPIELKNDLDITVVPGTRLELTGTLTPATPTDTWNVSITADSAGYPGAADPASGNVVISGNVAPGGAFNVFGGVVNVVSGGSLTASSVYLGDRKSWNMLQVDAGATLITNSVAGDATLAIYGGTFATSTAGKPALDIRALSLGSGTNYTFEEGETQTISEILGNGDMTSTLTFDGGTMKVRYDNYSPYGGGYGCIGNTGIALANLYVTDKGANFNLNGTGVVVNQPFLDAPGLPGNAGPVIATNGVQFSMTGSPTFTGGFIFDNSGTTYAGSDPAWFGTGTVQVKNGAGVTYETDIIGEHIAIATNFFLTGPAVSPFYATLEVDWRGSVEFVGTVDVTDLTTYPVGDQRNFGTISAHSHAVSPQCYIDIAGPIVGTGGVQFGKEANVGAVANGLVYVSGSEPNTFAGDAVQTMGVLVLRKADGVVAIPHDLILLGIDNNSGAMLGANNQTSATDTVLRLNNPRTDLWTNFALNGFATTVRGITSDPNGLNGIDNLTIAPNGNGFTDFMVAPATQGTLTINTQAGDDFTYTSYIADYVHAWAGLDVSTIGKVALVKDGPGIQRLTPGAVWTAGYYIYTGGTTVKDGVLDVSTVTSFTPNSPVSIEGGELRLGDSFVGQVFSSVTLKSGYLTGLETIASTSDYDVQDGLATVGLTGAVGLTKTTGGVVTLSGPLTYAGNTDIQAGTLEIAGTATLTTITGSDGALTVCTGASLTAASIQVDTLTIGGAPTHTPPLAATVPEPCSIVLLALAGMMIGWFKFRNR